MANWTESRKAALVSAIAAAAGCILLWGVYYCVDDLSLIRPMLKKQVTPFWLSLFLLIFAGVYYGMIPHKLDDE